MQIFANGKQLFYSFKEFYVILISKRVLKQIEVKIIGKNAQRFDWTSIIIKPKSEDKICIYINKEYVKYENVQKGVLKTSKNNIITKVKKAKRLKHFCMN